MDWLREWSVDVVRELLGLDGPIVLRGGPHADPEWAGGGAVIDNRDAPIELLDRRVELPPLLRELVDLAPDRRHVDLSRHPDLRARVARLPQLRQQPRRILGRRVAKTSPSFIALQRGTERRRN